MTSGLIVPIMQQPAHTHYTTGTHSLFFFSSFLLAQLIKRLDLGGGESFFREGYISLFTWSWNFRMNTSIDCFNALVEKGGKGWGGGVV